MLSDVLNDQICLLWIRPLVYQFVSKVTFPLPSPSPSSMLNFPTILITNEILKFRACNTWQPKWANLVGNFNDRLYFFSFTNVAHITLLDKKMSLFHVFVL